MRSTRPTTSGTKPKTSKRSKSQRRSKQIKNRKLSKLTVVAQWPVKQRTVGLILSLPLFYSMVYVMFLIYTGRAWYLRPKLSLSDGKPVPSDWDRCRSVLRKHNMAVKYSFFFLIFVSSFLFLIFDGNFLLTVINTTNEELAKSVLLLSRFAFSNTFSDLFL